MTHGTERPSGRRTLPWQVVGSAAAGACCWVLDFALLWLLAVRLDVATSVAAATSFTLAGVVNYLLNHLVFAGPGEPRTRDQVLRYLLLTAANIVLVAVGVPVLEQVAATVLDSRDLSLLVAKLVVTALLVVPNALVYRHWVFRGR